MAVTKTDIQKLLKQGLTGWEIGKLVLQDSVEVDHDREGFLSEADISRLKRGLQRQKDIDDYNKLINTYRIVMYTLAQARIFVLEAMHFSHFNQELLMRFYLDWQLFAHLYTSPLIVTEKQYHDIEVQQRQEKLKEIYDLETVLCGLAEEVAPDFAEEQYDAKYCHNDFLEFLEEERPDQFQTIYQEAVSKLITLIAEEKLFMVLLRDEERFSLEKTNTKIEELRQKYPNYKRPPEDEERWLSLVRQFQQLRDKFIQAGRRRKTGKSGDRLIKGLQKMREGSLSHEEKNRLLHYAFCSAEDLYRAGCARVVKLIDTPLPGYSDIEPHDGRGYAILKNPDTDQVDERGYYKDNWKRLLDISGLDERERRMEAKGRELQETLKTGNKALRVKVQAFLAIKSVLETVSEMIGIDFAEDIREWYREFNSNISYYNTLIRQDVPYSSKIPKLPAINLEKLAPTEASLKYYRERLAMSLGEEWWRCPDGQQGASEIWHLASEVFEFEADGDSQEEAEEVRDGEE